VVLGLEPPFGAILDIDFAGTVTAHNKWICVSPLA
jgi:hypothetical protein